MNNKKSMSQEDPKTNYNITSGDKLEDVKKLIGQNKKAEQALKMKDNTDEMVASDSLLSSYIGTTGTMEVGEDAYIKDIRVGDEKGQVITYVDTVRNSQFWTSIEMLLNWIDHQKVIDPEYLRIGLKNTLKQGYQIRKKNDTGTDDTK